MSGKDLVGCAKVNPLLQEIVKTSSGGMAAVSAGIVAFFMSGRQPESPLVLFALAMIALSIPLLVGSRLLYNMFDNYEHVSVSADQIMESLFLCGFLTAFAGYGLLLATISKVVFYAFLSGLFVVVLALWLVGRQQGSPQMRRKVL